MITAVISDLHANLEAVEATFSDIARQKVDEVLCLGDLVGYFANPNECVELIRSRGVRCVMGNHDRVAAGLAEPTNFGETARRAILWTRQELSDDNRRFLAGLPMTLALGELLLVHGALTPEPNVDLHVSSLARAEQSLTALRDRFSARICLFGHTHRPMLYRLDDSSARAHKGEGCLSLAGHCLVNPGSVGQSRDADARASYVILDGENATFRRVEFARAATLAKASHAGLLYRQGPVRRAIGEVQSVVRHSREALRRFLLRL
jgi:predicted phosphodiesterase